MWLCENTQPITLARMSSARERADDYRKEAQSCIEVANRMSVTEDRIRLLQMAQHWLELAKKADKADNGEE